MQKMTQNMGWVEQGEDPTHTHVNSVEVSDAWGIFQVEVANRFSVLKEMEEAAALPPPEPIVEAVAV